MSFISVPDLYNFYMENSDFNHVKLEVTDKLCKLTAIGDGLIDIRYFRCYNKIDLDNLEIRKWGSKTERDSVILELSELGIIQEDIATLLKISQSLVSKVLNKYKKKDGSND